MLLLLVGCPKSAGIAEAPQNHIYTCVWVNTGDDCSPSLTTCQASDLRAIEFCTTNKTPATCVNNGVTEGDPC